MNWLHLDNSIPNPLNGVLPDFSIFGPQFNQLWVKLVAGLWGLALIATVVFLILGLIAMGAATTTSNPAELKMARQKTIGAGIVLGCLAAFAVIVGAILAVF